jgi:DNA-binding transcriptional MocR family regulator
MATMNLSPGLTHLQPMVSDDSSSLARQVVRHVNQTFACGDIGPGGRLPSERTVATDLGVSRNTVTAAFNELEQRGLIRRIRGKGAFRCSMEGTGASFSWSGKISKNAHLLDEPILDMLARSGVSGLPYPLSAGTPALACFPTKEYQTSVNKIIERDFPHALAVAPAEGQLRLRRSIAGWMNVEPNRVFITFGGQEGIDLLARCLIDSGDCAIVESPTYPGAIQCLCAAGARLIGWETDWSLDKLEELLIRYRPKLIFTTPTFQNPTGKVMSLAVRIGMLELAARYHTPIIEDDVYSRTYLNGHPPPPSLLKLDQHSQVVYLSTFSKVLAPGLRVGWLVAPPYMVKQMSLMKMRANLFTGGLNQLVLSELIECGSFDRHLERLRSHHRILCNAAVSAVQPASDEGLLSFNLPTGGLYLWCKLKHEIDLDSLIAILEERGVSVAPGHVFRPVASKGSYIRICYTAAAEPTIRLGVEILSNTLREMYSSTVSCLQSDYELLNAKSA